jgi:hypothetical protein
MEPTNSETDTPASDARRPWQTPRVESSEVFTAAGLACCLIFDGENQVPQGSQGTGLEPC